MMLLLLSIVAEHYCCAILAEHALGYTRGIVHVENEGRRRGRWGGVLLLP